MSTPSVDLVRRRGWARSLLSRPTGLFGLVTTAVLLACAIVSLFWTPYDPILTDVANKWQPPSAAHLLGTDNIGRDIFSVLLAGSRVTVQVAVGSAVVAAIVGVVFAALGALTTRWVREIVAVLIDILIAFPTLLIAMMLASAFGGSLAVVIVAVGISFGVNVGRVTRPEIRRVSRSEFVTAGIAAGLARSATLRGTCCRTSPPCSSCSCRGAWPSPFSPRRASRTSATARRSRRRHGAECSRSCRHTSASTRGPCCGRASPSRSRFSASICSATACATRPIRASAVRR